MFKEGIKGEYFILQPFNPKAMTPYLYILVEWKYKISLPPTFFKLFVSHRLLYKLFKIVI